MIPREIAGHEREICGKWIVKDKKIQADESCSRIESLIANHLRLIGHDASGWDRLYLDPNDGRYWELTFPESELHGGGPPRLVCISEKDARIKYDNFLNETGEQT